MGRQSLWGQVATICSGVGKILFLKPVPFLWALANGASVIAIEKTLMVRLINNACTFNPHYPSPHKKAFTYTLTLFDTWTSLWISSSPFTYTLDGTWLALCNPVTLPSGVFIHTLPGMVKGMKWQSRIVKGRMKYHPGAGSTVAKRGGG